MQKYVLKLFEDSESVKSKICSKQKTLAIKLSICDNYYLKERRFPS